MMLFLTCNRGFLSSEDSLPKHSVLLTSDSLHLAWDSTSSTEDVVPFKDEFLTLCRWFLAFDNGFITFYKRFFTFIKERLTFARGFLTFNNLTLYSCSIIKLLFVHYYDVSMVLLWYYGGIAVLLMDSLPMTKNSLPFTKACLPVPSDCLLLA